MKSRRANERKLWKPVDFPAPHRAASRGTASLMPWCSTLAILAAGCGAGDTTCVELSGADCAAAARDSVDGLSVNEREFGLGARGEVVREVNAYFSRYGYFPNDELLAEYPEWRPILDRAPADPVLFDEQTEAAVLELQARSALPRTGRVDEATLSKLRKPRCAVPDGSMTRDPSEKYNHNGTGIWDSHAPTWKVIGVSGARKSGNVAMTKDEVHNIANAAFLAWSATGSLNFQGIAPTSPTGAQIELTFANISGGGIADASGPDINGGNDNGGTIRLGTTLPNGSTRIWSVDGTPTGTEVELKRVLIHEIGHAIGLAHTSVENAAMDADSFNGNTLTVDDRVGRNSLYGMFLQAGSQGNVQDVAVGGDGPDAGTRPDVWYCGGDARGGGYDIYKLDEGEIGGGCVEIAVNSTGRAWRVTDEGKIYKRTEAGSGGNWGTALKNGAVEMCAKDIAIRTVGGGFPWVIGCDNQGVGYSIWQGTSDNSWVQVDGVAIRIAVDALGDPWVVNLPGDIFRLKRSGCPGGASVCWQQVPGRALDIGAGPALTQTSPIPDFGTDASGAAIGRISYPWIIGNQDLGNGFGVYAYNIQGNRFDEGPQSPTFIETWRLNGGRGFRIALAPNGVPWVIGNDRVLWTFFHD